MQKIENKYAVMSLSGGMDSTALLLHLIAKDYNVFALSFDYGQKHKIELTRARKNIRYLEANGVLVNHRVIDLKSVMGLYSSALTTKSWKVPEGHYEQDNMKATVVPNRNAIFSSLIYGYALSIAIQLDTKVDVCLGVHSGDHAIYPDCREQFFMQLFKAFAVGNWESHRVCMYLPYIDGNKKTILQDAIDSIYVLQDRYGYQLEFDTIFRNTNTSYNPDHKGRASGTSGADIERILAFNELGIPDPARYTKSWKTVLKNALYIEKQHKNGEVK